MNTAVAAPLHAASDCRQVARVLESLGLVIHRATRMHRDRPASIQGAFGPGPGVGARCEHSNDIPVPLKSPKVKATIVVYFEGPILVRM